MKRFRYNGRAMSKFDMACEMNYWHNLPWDVMCDAFDYEFMVNRFKEFISEKTIHG